MLSDRYEGVAFWTSTEATDAINEALLMWNLLTGMWSTPITIMSVAGTNEYALTASVVFGTRVEYEGRTLNKSYQWEMDNGRPGWQTEQLGDVGVPNTVQKWIPLGLKRIALWPVPDTTNDSIVVDGVAATPRLSAGGDYIDVGSELINAIVGYALHTIVFKEGGQRFQTSIPLYQDFLKQAAGRNDLLTELFRQQIMKDYNREQEHPRA